LNVTRSGTSNQCRISCRTCVKPWSNFRVLLTIRAAEFMTLMNWIKLYLH